MEDDQVPISTAEPIVEVAGENDSCVTFVLTDEDHTLGNAVRYMLARRPGIDFVGYSIPHPSENRLNIRVQSTPKGETAAEAFDSSLKDLAVIAGIIADKFTDAVHESNTNEAMQQ
mmetsp:Transcript_125/g.375  ORF Transcript_125/g.375 Transcript_125/m.375 type:complete len:116 (+) Transcript_125:68-415(+)|eukprot:CAMPEP_0198722584 /NCGR_PEP_ID=MMETSP1475-20131203/264_1 /TAXON_ID= ORGANISM="Unidentified sp., Strain CCMP1999" /NCGR_SAMPLE_ID=MMETSP1475 /ASSEMBLY_ACC=CAM_ASM_001111 /LENGTH=115 /DNA_ID=CAMNT_0044483497 /DNA_START=35 /DNA_END=382 /DNA_ORIENTATION=+